MAKKSSFRPRMMLRTSTWSETGSPRESTVLELLAVLSDERSPCKVAKLHVEELHVEDESTGFLVAMKLGLDGKPGSTRWRRIHHGVDEVSRECADDPRVDHAVHANPVQWSARACSRAARTRVAAASRSCPAFVASRLAATMAVSARGAVGLMTGP